MNFALFSDLSTVTQFHLVAALGATLLGPVALFRNRRDAWHRRLGYAWVILMTLVAVSAFFIHSFRLIGPFSPIHLLAVYTLYNLVRAVQAARARRITEHRTIMRQMYFQALGIAGLFAFLPGRALHQMVFGTDTWAGFALLAAVVGGALTLAFRQTARPA